MNRHRRARGFTLMELLVVIVLVGVLASLAMARYLNLRDKSMVAAATYDLDLARKMLAYYATDYSRYPATVSDWDDLQNQLVDPYGNTYGDLPLAYTFTLVSYELDEHNDYTIRVQVGDHMHTVLQATPELIRLD
jgi:prepilin-type N-terminal cleavage/methylation domain-containing protein